MVLSLEDIEIGGVYRLIRGKAIYGLQQEPTIEHEYPTDGDKKISMDDEFMVLELAKVKRFTFAKIMILGKENMFGWIKIHYSYSPPEHKFQYWERVL